MTQNVLDRFSLEDVNTMVSLASKVSVDDLVATEGYFDAVLNAEYLVDVVEWVKVNAR